MHAYCFVKCLLYNVFEAKNIISLFYINSSLLYTKTIWILFFLELWIFWRLSNWTFLRRLPKPHNMLKGIFIIFGKILSELVYFKGISFSSIQLWSYWAILFIFLFSLVPKRNSASFRPLRLDLSSRNDISLALWFQCYHLITD